MDLFKILRFLAKGDKSIFDYSVEDQSTFLDSLPEPHDDIDRSYLQFLCQDYFVAKAKSIFFDAVSVFAIPVIYVVLWVKSWRVKYVKPVDTICEDKKMPGIIPDELVSEFDLNYDAWHSGYALSANDIGYLIRKVWGPRKPYFVLKLSLRVATYSAMITKYRPKRIIAHTEFSFCSSALTDYCHHRGVCHINVMHGEKLYFIRDAFFRFDECYVWDEHYVKIFERLRSETSQFRIAIPPSLKVDTSAYENKNLYADYKYYLAYYTEADLKSIVESMDFVRREGKTIKFRFHPRYSDLKLLKKYVADCDIEDPFKVSISESISNMHCAIGEYTTVMLQAYFSGKQVLLDDVTNKAQFDAVASRGYILVERGGERLSSKLSI